MSSSKSTFERRKARVRRQLRRTANGRPRLSVSRSDQHIYAQIICDQTGKTLASASTIEKELRPKIKNGGNIAAAEEIGNIIAERGKKAGVEDVVFDRGGYIYHGRVKALADAARENGLKF